jgi:hypothetical protein
MNTITQRLAAGFAAALASTITLGAVLAVFSAPVRAADAEQVQQSLIGGVAVAQRYRAAQPAASDIQLDLRAGTTADVRVLARQADARAALSHDAAGFAAWSKEAAGFAAWSKEAAGFAAWSKEAAGFAAWSKEAAGFAAWSKEAAGFAAW